MNAREAYDTAYRLLRQRQNIPIEMYHTNFDATDGAVTSWLNRRRAELTPIWKLEGARRILGGLFGGITREPGFENELSDTELVSMMRRYGYSWNGHKWVDTRMKRAIRNVARYHGISESSIPASWIWG